MFIIRPITTLACGAVGMALVAFDLLRSNMSNPTFADISRPADDTIVMSSERLFEFNKAVPTDEVNPELIAQVSAEATETLLRVADGQGRALDWHTFNFHLFGQVAEGVSQAIVRIDVLQ